jgi:6-phosphogluconolactonase
MAAPGARSYDRSVEPATQVQVFPDANAVVRHAARTLLATCRETGARRIALALSGGSTPALLYGYLAEELLREVPWSRLEVFFGDERAVPPDHAESNFGLAWRTLLSHAPIPPEQVHRMAGEAADLALAAEAYEDDVVRAVSAGPLGEPAFDLIWLGLGEDGHTASLFPGTGALSRADALVVANDVPQLATRRLTFTLPLINAAKRVQFLILGSRKAEIVKAVLEAARRAPVATGYPAARVRPPYGRVEWLLDRDAAAGMEATALTGDA